MITFWIISYVPVWARPTLVLPDRDPPGCSRPGVPDRDQGKPDRDLRDLTETMEGWLRRVKS